MQNKGFSAIELMVTLAISAILLAIAAPSFRNITASSNMVSNSDGMIAAFNYARTESLKRGSSVKLGQLVTSSWTGGVIVWIDSDDDDSLDTGEVELRRWEPFDSASTVSSTDTQNVFAYNASGEVDISDASGKFILTICDDRTGEEGRSITILTSGAIIADKVTCG
jgi:type IV fimbrial biogenesis protein FimT